ncbi:hypothetical protein BS47DRAFT_1397670 [Hydnum rufescens UP504]|uniref:Uncharacterized protein n=1 Tax=Hydnum rufescens UP504 TaxID=1448309 RepID=A0A9P6AMI7_9AGAM|nr:hypothetical protein BS47DRAFT_1397670 [Hydnum rufescens UP504]
MAITVLVAIISVVLVAGYVRISISISIAISENLIIKIAQNSEDVTLLPYVLTQLNARYND